jgi:LemA protein
MITTILLVAIVLIIIYAIYVYNNLVKLQNLTKEGWSGIDVQLKQRANLIPNLVESVKGYMGHESGVLEKVTALRAQCLASGGSVEDRAKNENMLTSALRQLFAVSENYPDLKASQNFIELQKTLTNIEDQIQLARRYYNGTARDFNIAIQSFPSNLIANAFHFTSVAFFEIEDAKEREVPTVKFS